MKRKTIDSEYDGVEDGCTLAFFAFICFGKGFNINKHIKTCVNSIHTHKTYARTVQVLGILCRCHLHMLWMLADAIDELIRLKFSNANIVNCREQWESIQIANLLK